MSNYTLLTISSNCTSNVLMTLARRCIRLNSVEVLKTRRRVDKMSKKSCTKERFTTVTLLKKKLCKDLISRYYLVSITVRISLTTNMAAVLSINAVSIFIV